MIPEDYLDITEIKKLIPHRYPLLLVDRVVKFKKDDSIVAIKNVTFNEQYFIGHFPNNPVMPGVLIIEAMAQASAILVNKSQNLDQNNDVYFMSIENAKFRKIVIPGDTLYLHSKIERSGSKVWKFSSYAEVNNSVVAESTFAAIIKRSQDKKND